MRRFSKAEKKLSMSMRTKEKHLKCLQKLTKAKCEKEPHKCESSGCEVLGMGEVESLRGKKLQTEERFSARDIRFLAEEFNILRGKPQLYFEGVESMHNKGKGCCKGCVTK
jgi:hypothetical protein